MLRRLIASILGITVLGYGISWAFAGHALGDADRAAAGGVHEHSQTALDESGCDHCCHASAHMTGLAPPLLKLSRRNADSFRLVRGCTVATLFSAPPLKPPRS